MRLPVAGLGPCSFATALPPAAWLLPGSGLTRSNTLPPTNLPRRSPSTLALLKCTPPYRRESARETHTHSQRCNRQQHGDMGSACDENRLSVAGEPRTRLGCLQVGTWTIHCLLAAAEAGLQCAHFKPPTDLEARVCVHVCVPYTYMHT